MQKPETIPVLMVGLGAMGAPMAVNLARADGIDLTGFDARPDAAVSTDAAWRRASSIADGLVDGGIVLICLPRIDHVEHVCAEILQSSRRPRCVIDASTSDPQRTRALAAQLEAYGIGFLDAPVARGRHAAAEGTLLAVVGGDEALLEAVRPILSVVASDVMHCGPVGAGQTVKVLNNMVMLMNVTAVAEAMAIADRQGVDVAMLVRALRSGSAGSFALSGDPGQALETGEFPEGLFAVDYAIKDARLAADLAGETGEMPAALRTTLELLEGASAAGHGQDYYPAMVRTLLDADERSGEDAP